MAVMPTALEVMQDAPVIPVIVLQDVAHAVPLARALVAGGIRMLEVTLRTPNALKVMEEMSKVEGAIVGSGTVRSALHMQQSVDAGCRFMVSPGISPRILDAADDIGVRAAFDLPIQQYPRIDASSLIVTTVYVGAPADTVRGFITEPVERAVQDAHDLRVRARRMIRPRVAQGIVGIRQRNNARVQRDGFSRQAVRMTPNPSSACRKFRCPPPRRPRPALPRAPAPWWKPTCCAPPSTTAAWSCPAGCATRCSCPTRAGSSGSCHVGLPVRTLQKPQRRVHVSPRIMNVAVPRSQHSPMFGQAASWQTVCRFSALMIELSSR